MCEMFRRSFDQGRPQADIQQTQIADNAQRQHPDAVGCRAHAMHNEWKSKKADGEAEYCSSHAGKCVAIESVPEIHCLVNSGINLERYEAAARNCDACIEGSPHAHFNFVGGNKKNVIGH